MKDFRPVDRAFFQVLRKVFAFVFASNLLILMPDFELVYGSEGWIDVDLLRMTQQFPALGIQSLIKGLQSIGFTASQSTWFIIGFYLILCGGLAFTPYWRACVVLLLLLDVSIFSINQSYSYGADTIRASLLFYLALTPRCPGFYLWLYMRVVQIHLCLIYFFGGLLKAMGGTWWNGEAVWKAANLPYFQAHGSWHLELLANKPWLAIILGWLVVLLEQFYSLAVYSGRLRVTWITITCLMHAFIAYFMGLWHFSMLMISWNIAAFIIGPMILEKYYPKNQFMFNASRRAKDAASALEPPA